MGEEYFKDDFLDYLWQILISLLKTEEIFVKTKKITSSVQITHMGGKTHWRQFAEAILDPAALLHLVEIKKGSNSAQ